MGVTGTWIDGRDRTRRVYVDEFAALAVGVAAALSFPLVVVAVHARRERRRNRKLGTRRNDKIRLTGDE